MMYDEFICVIQFIIDMSMIQVIIILFANLENSFLFSHVVDIY